MAYSVWEICLESLAAFFGIVSVLYSIRKDIFVYPTGIISTVIYSYLLFEWKLYGDMLINVYYTAMSFYGLWYWFYKREDFSNQVEIENARNLGIWVGLFVGGFIAVVCVYWFVYGSLSAIRIVNYIDSMTAAVFIVAMYLMARKRIESWIFWMLGNAIAIYLFVVKGYAITAFQYLIFLMLALRGWFVWRKIN